MAVGHVGECRGVHTMQQESRESELPLFRSLNIQVVCPILATDLFLGVTDR